DGGAEVGLPAVPRPRAGVRHAPQRRRQLRVAVRVVVERVEVEAARVALDVAGVAAEPVIVRTFRVVEQRLALPLRRRLLRPAQRDRSYYLARLRVYHLQGVEQVVGDDDPFAVRGAGEAQRPAAQRDAAQPLLQQRLLHEIAGVAAGPRDLFRVEEQQFVRA